MATQAIPTPNNPIPIAYLKFALGLYLLSHHFENKGAKPMINNEFKIKNQDASISALSLGIMIVNFQIAIPQMAKKLIPKIYNLHQ